MNAVRRAEEDLLPQLDRSPENVNLLKEILEILLKNSGASKPDLRRSHRMSRVKTIYFLSASAKTVLTPPYLSTKNFLRSPILAPPIPESSRQFLISTHILAVPSLQLQAVVVVFIHEIHSCVWLARAPRS